MQRISRITRLSTVHYITRIRASGVGVFCDDKTKHWGKKIQVLHAEGPGCATSHAQLYVYVCVCVCLCVGVGVLCVCVRDVSTSRKCTRRWWLTNPAR